MQPGRDVEDYAWRPTFLPRMREQRLEPASLQKASTRFFAAYAERVAVLDQPKRALRVLRNHERMAMMQSAAESVCKGMSLAGTLSLKGFSRDSRTPMTSSAQAPPSPGLRPARACCHCCAPPQAR